MSKSKVERREAALRANVAQLRAVEAAKGLGAKPWVFYPAVVAVGLVGLFLPGTVEAGGYGW